MCLSIAYKNKVAPENIIAKNVMSLECLKGQVVLTDLMERKTIVNGFLQSANLEDSTIVIATED